MATTKTSRNATASLKTFSSYSDGLTIMVMAKSERNALSKTAAKIADLEIDGDIGFFQDDIDSSYIDDQTTVSQFLANKGVTLDANVILVIEGDGADGIVTSYKL